MRYPGREGGFDIGETDLEELLWKLKDEGVILIIAPLGPTEELPVICGLCGTPYDEDECPACKTERAEAKAMIERTLKEYWGEKGSVIRDVEE